MTWDTLPTEANLGELARLIERLEEFVEPGPRSHLPRWRSPEQLRAERELIRREREERVLIARRGLAYVGSSRAPVVITVASALATVHVGLCRLEALMFDRLRVMPWPADIDPPDERRCERISERLGLLEDPFASWLAREVTRLVTVATAAADEDRQIVMGRPCPICGRSDTLVVYVDRDYVRCNADAGCVCSVPDCRCRRTPGWRHVWRRPQWGVLSLAIQVRVERDRQAERVRAREAVAA
jgi:hypothetical protein